ncbi:hypothetical protein HJC23_003169 [Cyclotella cryptica]|uniref:Homeobox domain-containing protein n=1 Tax=Cyclotella cryptica TaxID=29204 RepID=A0ABD3PNT1_9STRA
MPTPVPTSPRPRRKTAKAAAETISKALDNTDDSAEEDEYVTSGDTLEGGAPPSPKSRPPRIQSTGKRRSSSSSCPNAGKKCALSPETTEYLKNWMLSPDHIDHPYPTEEEKARIMRHCGIEMKQLTNWFVNNRKRIWKPKLEELKKRRGEDGTVVPIESEEDQPSSSATLDAKRKQPGVLSPKTAKSFSGVKVANTNKKQRFKGKGLVNNPLVDKDVSSTCSPSEDGECDLSVSDLMPPLPPPHAPSASATVTPLVDPMIISAFSSDDIINAPLLPMAGGGADMQGLGIMPHSCNLVDPLTNKMNRYVQPCALCSACRDWNAGEFCPWDLTGIIGDISDDTSVSATEEETLADLTIPLAKEEENTCSIVSEESAGGNLDGNTTTLSAMAVEVLSSEDGCNIAIGSFPSTASFPVPQEIGQGDLIADMVDIDVAWD